MLQFILKCCILFMYFYTCVTKSLHKPEGSSCTVGEYNGTCINYSKCYQMIPGLSENKPEICSYDGNVPIVCCTECEEFHVENISNAIYTPGRDIQWRNGRKSWNKCLDYIENKPYPCWQNAWTSIYFVWDKARKCHTVEKYTDDYSEAGNVKTGEVPHMVLLGYGEDLQTAKWHCGGSLISETFILTAGHCISTPKLGQVKYASLGILKRSDPPDNWEVYFIKNIIPHPKYKSPSRYHDIALLETDTPVEFSRLVFPACLPVDGMLDVDEMLDDGAEVAGWGALGHGKELADVLQKAVVDQFSHEECSSLYPKHRLLKQGYDNTTQMCFGSRSRPTDTCEGDSGGPLYVEKECQFYVLGVTSFGMFCGFEGDAGIYTRVEHYVPWIESIVWP